jgi:hypothetical protein
MSRTLTVYLAADLKKFSGPLRQAETQAKGFGGHIGRLGTTLSGMLGPALIGAGIAAGAMAVKLGVDGVKAAIEDEAAVAKLAQTMTNLGLAHDTAQVEASIASMETELGIVDMELRPAYDRLVRSIGDTHDAMKAMSLAADISAGTGKSLDAVVQALGRAYDGNAEGLSRLGAGLSSTLLKSGDMKAITEQLATTFGGQATTKAQTYEGQIKRLSLEFDNLKESFGRGFLTGLGDANDKTDELMATMKELEPELEKIGLNDAQGNGFVDIGGGEFPNVDKAGKSWAMYTRGQARQHHRRTPQRAGTGRRGQEPEPLHREQHQRDQGNRPTHDRVRPAARRRRETAGHPRQPGHRP